MGRFIRLYRNALPRSLCQAVIEAFQSSSSKAPGRTGGGLDPTKKLSTDVDLVSGAPSLASAVGKALLGTLADYIMAFPSMVAGAVVTAEHLPDGTRRELLITELAAEKSRAKVIGVLQACYSINSLNVQMYRAGEGHYSHWHSEIFPGPTSLNRVLFILIYLNDVVEGGATEFLHQKISVRPETGSVLLAPAGFTHTHRGNVPVSGDKYIVSSWLSFKTATGVLELGTS